jgi:hypothetical protein
LSRDRREFRSKCVREVMRHCRTGESWGLAGTFKTTGSYTKRSSFEWKQATDAWTEGDGQDAACTQGELIMGMLLNGVAASFGAKGKTEVSCRFKATLLERGTGSASLG